MGEVTLLRLAGFGQVMAVDLGGDVLRRQPGVRGVVEHRAHELVGLNDPACRQAPTTPACTRRSLDRHGSVFTICTQSRPDQRRSRRPFWALTCGYPSAPSRTRTDTGRILSPLPLPIGLWGPGGECSARSGDLGHRVPSNLASHRTCAPAALRGRIRAPRASLLF
jgi:hypothetical protein